MPLLEPETSTKRPSSTATAKEQTVFPAPGGATKHIRFSPSSIRLATTALQHVLANDVKERRFLDLLIPQRTQMSLLQLSSYINHMQLSPI